MSVEVLAARIEANDLASKESTDPLLAEANELVGIYTATVRRAKGPPRRRDPEG